MDITDVDRLRSIKSFPSLVKYLRDELDWPVDSDDFDELTYDYEPAELGIDARAAVKIKEIKQLRPLTNNQPFGIFFINFDPKRLPVVMLRRILRGLVLKKRTAAAQADKAAWAMNDLLFISSYGETEERTISFAYFKEDEYQPGDLPTLRVLGWDGRDTVLHLGHVHQTLKEKLQWPDDDANSEAWRERWASAFVTKHKEVITTAKALAVRLAELARDIRNRVNAVLEVESDRGPIRKLHAAFKQALIHDLSEDDFADMYAQTVAYGLLSARVSRPAGLVADNIVDMVPVSNPFLQELLETFLHLGGRKRKGNTALDFDELGVTEVVEVLRRADMAAVLRDFGDRNPQEDPVIHFYEDFLKAYDKQKRTQRGVFYTPRPVVSFIVRSVHELLQTEFGLEDGLADTATWGDMLKKHPELKLPMLSDDPQETKTISPEEPFVQVLDPATGTATFIVEVIEVIYKTLRDKWLNQGKTLEQVRELWNDYVPNHLLPRLHGYELMMAPYAIAHMKIGLVLQGTGYQFQSKERVRVYLTNALEPHQNFSDRFEFDVPALAHEAEAVNEIKRTKRFTVVVGNPPYSKLSANRSYDEKGKSTFIGNLIEQYKYVDGKGLGERNPKWLQDDYVKFIRLAQWCIDTSGCGVISMITNHGYVDNPTFKGLRRNLLSSANHIYIYDLHGNSRKKEKTPEGTEDNNVFDIQQGVAILNYQKKEDNLQLAQVYYADLWGKRETKYRCLNELSISTKNWTECYPTQPSYLFRPQEEELRDDYNNYCLLKDIFNIYSSTVTTARNNFSMAYKPDTLIKRITDLKNNSISDEVIRKRYDLKDVSYWSLSNARRQIQEIQNIEKFVKRYCYRPFDFRYVYYHKSICERMRSEVMRHMNSGNIALLTHRPQSPTQFTYAYCTNMIGDQCAAANKTGGGGNSFQFPLFLFPHGEKMHNDLYAECNCQLNFKPIFVQSLAKNLMLTYVKELGLPKGLTARDIFYYIYAVLYSPNYRTRYAEFLKVDFLRVPLPGNIEVFQGLSCLGSELVPLHLMESPRLNQHITTYICASMPTVEKVSYTKNTVWVDKAQTCGFQGVPEDVWEFHIGGYQVCEKWLKDRKGRTLSQEDIDHYHRIVVALHETIRIMGEIDKVIEAHGGWPGAFATAPLEPSAPASTGETDELPFA